MKRTAIIASGWRATLAIGVTDAIEEQTSVGETRERIVQRALAELVIQAAVLDRHRRLERECSGERESTLVDRAGRGGRQLRDAERIAVRDEREQAA